MEQKSEITNALSISTIKVPAVVAEIANSPVSSAKKRRRGAAQLIKVALFMIRRRSVKAKPVDAAAAGGNMLNRLVGSMRPLHLQSNDAASPLHHAVHDHTEPMSPAASSSVLSDNTDGMSSRYTSAANLQELDASGGGGSESRYASAVNLQEMDQSSGGSEESERAYEYDESGGDEMIDAKAEQFIAQFYAQIRLQRLNSIDRRYNEMIERSIA